MLTKIEDAQCTNDVIAPFHACAPSLHRVVRKDVEGKKETMTSYPLARNQVAFPAVVLLNHSAHFVFTVAAIAPTPVVKYCQSR